MFGEGGYGEKVILEQKEAYYKTREAYRLLPESTIPPILKARGLDYPKVKARPFQIGKGPQGKTAAEPSPRSCSPCPQT